MLRLADCFAMMPLLQDENWHLEMVIDGADAGDGEVNRIAQDIECALTSSILMLALPPCGIRVTPDEFAPESEQDVREIECENPVWAPIRTDVHSDWNTRPVRRQSWGP